MGNEDSVSPYLIQIDRAWPSGGRPNKPRVTDIGTYRALLARVIELHQEEITVGVS